MQPDPNGNELRAISAWCREQAIPLHFDGARLWEAAAGYGIAEAELASLADSVYVSYYKGLGGMGAAMVAGNSTFQDSRADEKSVRECRQKNHLNVSGLIGHDNLAL